MPVRKRSLYAEAPQQPPLLGWAVTSIILLCAAVFTLQMVFQG